MILSPHHAPQGTGQGTQSVYNSVGQQPQRNKEHGDPQQEQAVGAAALDEPGEQSAEQAKPSQQLQQNLGNSRHQPHHSGKHRAKRGEGKRYHSQHKTHNKNLLIIRCFQLFSPYIYIIPLP